MTRREFDIRRIYDACTAFQAAVGCTTSGDDASVAGGAIRELLDALGAVLTPAPIPAAVLVPAVRHDIGRGSPELARRLSAVLVEQAPVLDSATRRALVADIEWGLRLADGSGWDMTEWERARDALGEAGQGS